MTEPEDTTKPPAPGEDPAARARYLEYREQQLRFDREYLERIKQHDASAAEEPAAKPDLPWGHPICDTCPTRVGCGLQQAMKKVDDKSRGR